MSPEQAKGRAADKRSDIWAFGAVLYEMLSGQRAFKGEDVSDTLASVLRQDVDWIALPDTTPAALRRLIARCLDRDPKRRLRDIGEARIVLDDPASQEGDAIRYRPLNITNWCRVFSRRSMDRLYEHRAGPTHDGLRSAVPSDRAEASVVHERNGSAAPSRLVT